MAPNAALYETPRITRTPGVCGGKPCIAGTRIRVLDVYVWHEVEGKTPDDIIRGFPHLTRADVDAAVTYIRNHRDRVLADIAEEHRISNEMRARHPSKLRRP